MRGYGAQLTNLSQLTALRTQDKSFGVFSPGLWRRGAEFELVCDARPQMLGLGAHLLPQKPVDVVLGWGLRSSTKFARHYCARKSIAFWSAEDGFLRSVGLGRAEMSVSMVLDDLSIYYDAANPSRLEALIHQRINQKDQNVAAEVLQTLRDNRLSKYNAGKDCPSDKLHGLLEKNCHMIVDQTANDASVFYGLANSDSFLFALKSVLRENPDDVVLIKGHPDVLAGRKKGYLSPQVLAQVLTGRDLLRTHYIAESINPWVFLDHISSLHVVTSQLGLEGIAAGVDVITYGFPFYAGWGLTNDRFLMAENAIQVNTDIAQIAAKRRAGALLSKPDNDAVKHALFAAAYLDYATYYKSVHGQLAKTDFAGAVSEIIWRKNKTDS